MKCWVCDGEDIVYTDVLEMHWCEECFKTIYMGEPKAANG